jgi:hypothetical protein
MADKQLIAAGVDVDHVYVDFVRDGVVHVHGRGPAPGQRVGRGDELRIAERWPFDGWAPAPGKPVIAEVYPSIFRKRYAGDGRSADEHDAYAVARWMADMAARGALAQHFDPPLTAAERAVADLEGWILGVR